MRGTGSNFEPNRTVTRAHATAALVRTLKAKL
ncbi:MAG: hypothetical protein GX295_10705 [Syntrophomonadaceae bacterium]|nr:hypothetical protein [Syntrophomonadaceae bacterium]